MPCLGWLESLHDGTGFGCDSGLVSLMSSLCTACFCVCERAQGVASVLALQRFQPTWQEKVNQNCVLHRLPCRQNSYVHQIKKKISWQNKRQETCLSPRRLCLSSPNPKTSESPRRNKPGRGWEHDLVDSLPSMSKILVFIPSTTYSGCGDGHL